MDDEDLATIRAAFQLEFVQGQGEFFLGRLPLREELREDERARRALRSEIIVRRPQVSLSRRHGVGRLRQDAIELRRRNVIYLVRVAPSSSKPAHKNGPCHQLATFSQCFGVKAPTLLHTEVGLLGQGFLTEGYSPFYALCIDGLPSDRLLMQRMESGVRNLFGRQGLRLRQHAAGVLHPGNRSVLAETFEFVYTDALCNTPFNLYQKYARRLDAGRRWVGTLVRVFDARRERIVQDERNEILWRYDADIDGFVLGHDEAVMEEELQAVEANHPRVDVRHLYFSVLEYAAATVIVRP